MPTEQAKTGFTADREAKQGRTYAALGLDEGRGLQTTQWGVGTNRNGELIGLYSNPMLVQSLFTDNVMATARRRQVQLARPSRICDFGGGDGIVLDLVQSQLGEQGYETVGVNMDMTEKSLRTMLAREGFSEGWGRTRLGVKGNLQSSPIREGSVDIGLSRYVLQYFPLEQQAAMLGNMWDAMSNDSILVVQVPWAVESSDQARKLNGFFSQVEGVINNTSPEEVLRHKYYPSIEDLQRMATALPNVRRCEVGLVDEFQWVVSPDAYADRFKLDEKRLESVRELFLQEGVKGTTEASYVNFGTNQGGVVLTVPDALLILEKG